MPGADSSGKYACQSEMDKNGGHDLMCNLRSGLVNCTFNNPTAIYQNAWLNPDLTPNYEGHDAPMRTDEEKAVIQQLLDEKQDEITEMFDAVYELWGIEYLTDTP
ncbi:MAG: hypothetical protein ACI4EX_08260 [Lachnospiraceae bacterium]